MSVEGVRFCWYCDQPLTANQKVKSFMKDSPSAGGLTVELHETCVEKARYVRRTQCSVRR
ncbi:hypothetical protein OG698_10755 [Streptomyces sp. NBC_01003]|uniref:hypothetical protein n=1 Tax=unclassified Streptomyces TaxID=2593676 RepID=UPI0036A21171|nr:hypothetical protein OG698_10755 [Streptomyces sp. NBC_01003]